VGWGPGRSQACQVSSKSVQGFWLPEESKPAIFVCLALLLLFLLLLHDLYSANFENRVRGADSYDRHYGLYNRLGLTPNL